MDKIFNIILILHILSGSIALLVGLLVILKKKGDKFHVVLGRVFYYSMLIVGFSSILLSVIHSNYFLLMVGIFTLYMVGTGTRYIKLKMMAQVAIPKPLDFVLTLSMLLAGLFFIGIGIFKLLHFNFFGFVFITFGFAGLLFVWQDFINYRGKSKIKNYWLLAHLQRMTGAFIAALTAFLVVNTSFLTTQIPGFLFWILPSFLFTPLIIKWSKKHEIK